MIVKNVKKISLEKKQEKIDEKKFLSYSYVLHKFLHLPKLHEFLPCFALLKSREKLHQQDKIWEKICKDLKYEFIKSI